MKYFSAVALFMLLVFTGCSENKTETKEVVKKTEPVQQPSLVKDETIDKVANDIKDKTSNVIDTAAQMAKELSAESKVIADEVKVESNKVITKIAKETKQITAVAVDTLTEVKKEIDVKMDEVIENQEGMLTKEEISEAEALYLKCAGCHGQKAERSALNKSQIIQGWSVEQLRDSLMGYKAGTYGSVMKGLMQGQVSSLSDEQIELLAQYIATLK